MTDHREMLELAAKAAGYTLGSHTNGYAFTLGGIEWNPLTDDGDALRLAVKLRIDLYMDGPGIESPVVEAVLNTGAEVMPFAMETLDTGDPYAATRLAITRAAAEIGRNLVALVPSSELPEDNYYKTQEEAHEIGRSMK